MGARKLRHSWWVDFHWQDVRYRRRSPLNTRAGAQQYEATLRGRLVRGEPVDEAAARQDPSNVRFAEFAERWFETYVVPNNKRSEQYTKRLLLNAHLLPWFGGQRLQDIGGELIEQYKASKLDDGLRPKSVNNHLTVLSKCLRTAVEWDVLPRCPMIRKLKAEPPGYDYLLPDDSRALLADHVEPLWAAMVRVAIRTGLRSGELLALDWEDVDLSRRLLTVRRSCWQNHIEATKTYRVRHVRLTQDAAEALAGLPSSSGRVFEHAWGDRRHPYHAALDALHRICDRRGVRRIGWHVLRHTFASTLATAGVAIHVIQPLLGHTSVVTTQRYAHLAPSALTSAIDVLESVTADSGPGIVRQPVGNQRVASDLIAALVA